MTRICFIDLQLNSCNSNFKGPRILFELHEFRIMWVFILKVNSKGTKESVRIRWVFELWEFELREFNCIYFIKTFYYAPFLLDIIFYVHCIIHIIIQTFSRSTTVLLLQSLLMTFSTKYIKDDNSNDPTENFNLLIKLIFQFETVVLFSTKS